MFSGTPHGIARRLRPSIKSKRLMETYTRRTPPPPPPEIATLLQSYQGQPPHSIPLAQVVSFGEKLSPESVVASANFALSEIPRRLAQRVRSLDNLPFIVGTNPFIARIHKLNQDGFKMLASYPIPRSIEENWAFTRRLEDLVDAHSDDIPIMAKGFKECTKYMTPEKTSAFLNLAIRDRIALRLIAEQHIAISYSLRDVGHNDRTRDVGVIDRKTSPKALIKMCGRFVSELSEASLGSSPELKLEGQLDATFAYVPVHLEYILTEVLKNSFRATVERHQHSGNLPPVVITISPSSVPPSPARPAYMSLRIRDQGGGISPSNMKKIFSYAFTTAGGGASDTSGLDEGMDGGPYAAQHVGGAAAIGGSDSTSGGAGNMFGEITGKGVQIGLGTLAGLGYGLPLARLYASYFGAGSGLELVSLDGFGTDCFIKLRSLEKGGDEVLI
ncbi:26S proteasome regulatory subunit 7 [Tulasnella sp. JGI-2019a]|nr:26S proteasome regulatory subunit 7 [Tulasnella sp. JGI-2019a]KAG9008623.1 26S proteasome regulatory subunit 7 [Tulasnella sp. JGI-2019a]KAG9038490.1 26S proteasome regulatory subunit 7 [Tulasnella sp. JGI-2019a]